MGISEAASRVVDAIFSTSLNATLMRVFFILLVGGMISIACVKISKSIDNNTRALNQLIDIIQSSQSNNGSFREVNRIINISEDNQ